MSNTLPCNQKFQTPVWTMTNNGQIATKVFATCTEPIGHSDELPHYDEVLSHEFREVQNA